MPAKASINLDAQWLRQMAEGLRGGYVTDLANNSASARLLAIADNIEALDERNATAFARGAQAATDNYLSRRNVVPDEPANVPDNLHVIAAKALANGHPVHRMPKGLTMAQVEARRVAEALVVEVPKIPGLNLSLRSLGL